MSTSGEREHEIPTPHSDPTSSHKINEPQTTTGKPSEAKVAPSTATPPVSETTPIAVGETPPRPVERRAGARGTAAMDPQTRKEVARKGGLAVSRNKQHMAEIGRKGGQSVSKNREHMAQIGRKGGAASRGHR
jgi:general stress protein YciG